MAAGRCPGCGYQNASCKKVRSHMQSCEAVAALYKEDSSKVIDPQDEYRRYMEEDKVEERAVKEEKYAAMRAKRKQETVKHKVALAELDRKLEEEAELQDPANPFDA